MSFRSLFVCRFDGRSYQANFGQQFRNATTTDAQMTRNVVAYVIHEDYEPRLNVSAFKFVAIFVF
jgi:hypothetical protein